MKNILVTVLIIFLFLADCAFASGIRFRNINVGSGLSNNEINTIHKDSEGYVWFGTATGLNRYDGNEIRIFRNVAGDSTSLPDNYVEEVFEDSKGRLWVQTDGGYSTYDPVTETFRPLTDSDLRVRGIEGKPNLIRAAGTDLWIATGGTALYKLGLDAAGAKAREMIKLPVTQSNFTAIEPVAEQGFAIAVSDLGELFVIDYNSGKTIRSTTVPGSGRSNTVYSTMLDSAGRLWVYSFDGTYIYEISTGNWTDAPVTVSKCPVTTLAQDARGNIWIGYDNDGIEILGRDGERTSVTNNPIDNFSLANNSVRAFCSDRDGDGMWVGTYKKGVSVHYADEFCLDVRYIADINCLYPVRGENEWVWLGSDHEGLMKYNLATEEIMRFPTDRKTAIVCLDYDDRGTLWFGTYGGGLSSMKDGKLKNYTIADGLASNKIWSVLHNQDGTMWLGTLGAGIQLFNPADMSFKTFNSANSGLRNDYVSTLARASDGRIFIGSADSIYVLSPATHVISGVRRSGHTAINQLFYDSRGLLWIARRDGLECFDTRSDSLYTVPLSNRINDNIILGIIESTDHTMWASAAGTLFNISVSRNDKNEYSFRTETYDSRDGVVTESFNQRSFCLLPSGKIGAGTQSGIAVIEQKGEYRAPEVLRIMFTGLTVNHRAVAVGERVDGRTILPVALNRLEAITLNPEQNNIIVAFSTDNYANRTLVRFRYNMKGLDNDWIDCLPGEQRVAFNTLSPGKYVLRVEALDEDGAVICTSRPLEITVRSPWWATWWAKVFYVLLCAGVCAAIVLYIRKRERRRFAERRERDDRRKLDELNQLKFKFFTNISHELRTPLTLILSPTESMLKEKTDERDVRRLSTIKSNATRLLYLVNQILDFRKNEMSELRLHLSEGDLVDTARQACRSFADLTDRRSQNFEFIADQPEIPMEYDNDKVTKIILNLLSNAVKYTPEGGAISVHTGLDGDKAFIEVTDTGKGISETDKQHIFERFYRSEDTSDLNTGTGIGLSMVYEYVQLHKGSITVSDNTPCGTVFRVVIPAVKPGAKAGAVEVREEAPQEEASKKPKRPAVLFVDDNPDLTDFLRDEFGDRYDVSTAANGVEALDLVKTHKFDLIVSDIMMPEMDGVQLCRSLKSQPSTVNIPLILLTAKQDVGSVVEGLTLGADDYVTKPFDNEVLALRMARLIALRKGGLRHSLIEPQPGEIKITTVDEQFVAKAVEYVDANMSNSDLTVEEMASAMGMSRVHLYKRISALTGRTPIEFIRILRLRRATQYLRDSRLTIAEIAYNVGFNSPKYFSKYFKEEYGISPGEYQARESGKKPE